MTVVPILKAPFSILFLQPLHAARLLLAYSTAGVVCQRENGFEVVCSVLTHWSEQAGFEVVYRGTTRCSFDKKSVFFSTCSRGAKVRTQCLTLKFNAV